MGLLDKMTFRSREAAPPEGIDVLPDGAIRLTWPGGVEATIPAARLRDGCPCAGCVEEGTGKKILDPATIPADIHPLEIHMVGNYAVQIRWSDGHDTGIYTWQNLREASGIDPTPR